MGKMLSAPADRLPAVDRPGIGEVYLRHSDKAVRLAYLLTGDQALAEDLVQDAFVKLAGRLVHLRDPGAFDAYLRTTVVNLSRSHFRRKRVERAYMERARRDVGLIRAPAPDRSVDDREDLWRALAGLTQRQRAAIVLRFYEDLSEAEAATILDCAPGTVKSLVARGLEKLRSEMGGDEL
jgi:RNA polymerase sigma-70 factor (sigma-E family)